MREGVRQGGNLAAQVLAGKVFFTDELDTMLKAKTAEFGKRRGELAGVSKAIFQKYSEQFGKLTAEHKAAFQECEEHEVGDMMVEQANAAHRMGVEELTEHYTFRMARAHELHKMTLETAMEYKNRSNKIRAVQ